MDYEEFVRKCLMEAGDIALAYFGKVSASTKPEDNNQVLTEADLAIGKHLVEAVKSQYPSHNVIDEETGAINNNSDFTWVIDPIDGTSNFASNVNDYGIMLGLLHNGHPIAGGVIIPSTNDLYCAVKGRGAKKNGQLINVTDVDELTKVLVGCGIDSHVEDPEITIAECRILAEIVLNVRNIRNSGSDAVDAMYVASGRYGAKVEFTAKIWDNVAPQIICEEAGAVWSTINGQPVDYSDPLNKLEMNFPFCVAGPTLHKQLIHVMEVKV